MNDLSIKPIVILRPAPPYKSFHCIMLQINMQSYEEALIYMTDW